VRVWIEGESPVDGLRARITQTIDLLAGAEMIAAAATADDVYAAVREWLEAYLAG